MRCNHALQCIDPSPSAKWQSTSFTKCLPYVYSETFLIETHDRRPDDSQFYYKMFIFTLLYTFKRDGVYLYMYF